MINAIIAVIKSIIKVVTSRIGVIFKGAITSFIYEATNKVVKQVDKGIGGIFNAKTM